MLELCALLAGPLAVAQELQPKTIYYDYVDDSGRLRGGRADVLVGPRVGLPTTPAAWASWLRAGPPANRIDLVAVGDGYRQTELGRYHSHVDAALATMFDQEPFKTYATYFNLHTVDVVSVDAGVDHDPTYPLWRNTALDMGFWCSGIERLLCVNVSKAYSYAQNAPDVDMVLAVANSTKYGGAGYPDDDLATVSGGNGSAAEVALHEFGHSLGNLADEYDYGGGTYYTGPEPAERNVSTFNAAQMAAANTKWARWLNFGHSGFDGTVNTFEGAYYYLYDIYRPTVNSRMRSLNRPFNLPGAEALIIEIYKICRPIDDSTPTGPVLDGTETVYIVPLAPTDHALDIQWSLDGKPIAGATAATLDLWTVHLTPGHHDLGVSVVDNTWMVRDAAARAQWLTQMRAWNIQTPAVRGDLDCNRLVDFNDILPFVTALTDPAAYALAYPGCPITNGDVNNDGRVDFGDIDPFVELLSSL